MRLRNVVLPALLAPVLLTIGTPASAAAKRARCLILGDHAEVVFKGPCIFDSDRDGSFMISPVRGDFLIPGDKEGPGISSVSLDVTKRGKGEVRGLTGDGINSRWGEATRSKTDRACWVGEDFQVCVY